MKKLTSMTDFVLEQVKRKVSVISHMICIEDYAKFLKQALEIWQFVPCKLVDGVWEVLEEPVKVGFLGSEAMLWEAQEYRLKEYQQAKERCLFEGFEFEKAIDKHHYSILRLNKSDVFYPELWKKEIIEDLVPYNLTLTELKQIGL